MKKLCSTVDLHPRDRFDFWHSVVCETVFNHNSRPGSRPEFAAAIEDGQVAGLQLVRHENSAMFVTFNKRNISRLDKDDLLFCRPARGTYQVAEGNNQAELQLGELTLLDPRWPFISNFGDGTELLLVIVPRHELEARVGRVTPDMLARAFGASNGAASLTSSFMAMLPGLASHLSPAAAHMVRTQMLDLIGLTVAESIADEPAISATRSLALFRLKAAVEQNLTDARLSSSEVAAKAGMSVRYANKLLAEQEQSLGRLILGARLEKCRRALDDPLQAKRSISNIAYGWGFSDMTHFGRSFRKAYGKLPSEYRSGRMAQDIASRGLK